MRNRVIPYEGREGFCFISYCHKDAGAVFKLIGEMSDQGCRIWYDAGIPVGSEFTEEIAEQLTYSEVFVAFLSNAYMHSDFCRAELNFALSKKKKLIIIYLENVNLTSGFEMRLSMIQSILLYKQNDMKAVIRNLCAAKIIIPCIDITRQNSDQQQIRQQEDAAGPEWKQSWNTQKTVWQDRDAYIFSMRVLENTKNISAPELNKVRSKVRKINGFLRNESDFGKGSPQVIQCEQQIRQELEKVQEEIDIFCNSENKSVSIERMLKSCGNILGQLKIRAELECV